MVSASVSAVDTPREATSSSIPAAITSNTSLLHTEQPVAGTSLQPTVLDNSDSAADTQPAPVIDVSSDESPSSPESSETKCSTSTASSWNTDAGHTAESRPVEPEEGPPAKKRGVGQVPTLLDTALRASPTERAKPRPNNKAYGFPRWPRATVTTKVKDDPILSFSD